VLYNTRPWFESVLWQTVLDINRKLTATVQSDQAAPAAPTPSVPQKKGYDPARKVWDEATGRSMTLLDALNTCRACRDLVPFFLSDETFAAVSIVVTQDLIDRLSGVQQQILRNTIENYVTGKINVKELQGVFRHVEANWSAARTSISARSPVAAVQPQPLVS
jgi:hypothetical protein